MESCTVLNYIILLVIAVLVIHMICKAVSATKFAEGMRSGDTCQYPGVSGNYQGPSNGPPQSNFGPANLAQDNPENPEASNKCGKNYGHCKEKIENREHMAGDLSLEGSRECTVCSTDQSVDDYIRGSLLANAQLCKPKKEYTRDDVDDYRNEFLSFRNNINQTSNNDDMVDRVNYMYLAGNTDPMRDHKGWRIKDMFDDLNKKADLYDKPCVRMPKVDNLTRDGHYTTEGFRGNSYVRDNWVYDTEKVSNGGKFYDDIQGVDPDASYERAI